MKKEKEIIPILSPISDVVSIDRNKNYIKTINEKKVINSTSFASSICIILYYILSFLSILELYLCIKYIKHIIHLIMIILKRRLQWP